MKRTQAFTAKRSLDDATRRARAIIDSSSLFTSMRAGRLGLPAYVRLLRTWAIGCCVLEHLARQSRSSSLQAACPAELEAGALLLQDIAALDALSVPDCFEAAESAQHLADLLRGRAADPVALIGCAYAIQHTSDRIASAGEPLTMERDFGGAVCFLKSRLTAMADRRDAFFRQMDRALRRSTDRKRAAAAAVEALEWIGAMLMALDPASAGTSRYLATTLNPEAGRHPVPQDCCALEAAIRAAERCWAEYPYYEWRFGARGRRFATSDSAWLLTLAAEPVEKVFEQIQWLSGLLAARGMPSLLLEAHLRWLCFECANEKGGSAAGVEKLARAADELRAMRARHIHAERADELARQFDEQIASCADPRSHNLGRLLVSAVSDERAGLTRAVASLVDWLTLHAPEDWIQAARETLRRAESTSASEPT